MGHCRVVVCPMSSNAAAAHHFVPTIVTGHHALSLLCLFIPVRVSGFVVHKRVSFSRPSDLVWCRRFSAAVSPQHAMRKQQNVGVGWSLYGQMVARLQPAVCASKVRAASWPQIARWLCSECRCVRGFLRARCKPHFQGHCKAGNCALQQQPAGLIVAE
jgi:hypothetical protein